tara:strand:- start:275 stop:2068 length:1794 start_codon:yes stop_codon:yes gene_type:complete
MADGNNGGSGNSAAYDSSMTSYLKNRLPYNYNVLDSDESKNTKYKYFQHVGMRRPEALSKNSVTLNNDFNNTAYSNIERDSSFGEVMYATASEDKPGRMRDYRTMAAFSEIADALNEVCDETIVADENDDIVLLKFKNSDLDSDKRADIQKEWNKYIEHYDLHNHGWTYFRQFLIEGEVFFEQIIHKDFVNEGVLGIINIPSDLIDPVYSNIQNMLVKGFLYQKPIFDKNDPKKVEKYEPIPFEENQVVYINNSSYNETKEFIVPYIENARRAYRQLSMIEDAIVIHRMVHAPLRFVFNVDVGRLPVPQAEAYLRKLQQQYWSTKTFDADQGDIVKKYSPQSTLDSYWFAKRQGQEPTTVSEIGGTPGLGELADLMFFIKKLYRSLGVPTSRLDPEDSFRDGTDILREELKFATMIIRQQKKFASGLKRGFMTHLKLRKMWEDDDGYGITEQNINVLFNPPSNFHELRNNQKQELKINSFNNLIGTGKVSTTLALKKVMGWKDKEILANRELQRKDAELEFELAQIQAMGPGWKKQLLDQAAGAEGAEGGADMGGGMDLGGGMPPAFGGGEPAIGMDEPPNTGVPPEEPMVPEEPVV